MIRRSGWFICVKTCYFFFEFNFSYKPQTKLLIAFLFGLCVFDVSFNYLFVIFFLNKTSESRKLMIRKIWLFEVVCYCFAKRIFSKCDFVCFFFEFLVSFTIFHFGRSVVLRLNDFDLKISSFRLTFESSLRM